MILAVAILLSIAAGISKAVMDKVNFHFSESIFVKRNRLFWNPVYSSMNKYKDGIKSHGSKFFGATTFFVWTTDAWHLFQMINGVTVASLFFLSGLFLPWWSAVILYALIRGVFELFFKLIFKLKTK